MPKIWDQLGGQLVSQDEIAYSCALLDHLVGQPGAELMMGRVGRTRPGPSLCSCPVFNVNLMLGPYHHQRWTLRSPGLSSFSSHCGHIKQIHFLCFLSLLVFHWCLEGGWPSPAYQGFQCPTSDLSHSSNNSGGTEVTIPKPQVAHSQELSSVDTVVIQSS